MNRYAFNSGAKLRRVYRLCQLTWRTWHDVCEFVPKPVFKIGTYLDPDGNPTNDSSHNRIGLILNGPDGDVIVKEGEYIFWSGGVFEIAKPDGGYIQIHE